MNILKLIAIGAIIAIVMSGCCSLDEYYGSRRPKAVLPVNLGVKLVFNGIPLTL